jgi:hypothetical protein
MVQGSILWTNPRITGLCATPSVTETLQVRVRDRSHPKVTPRSANATFTTAASSKIVWQAGMSKGISDVRSYMAFEAWKPRGALGRRPGKVRNTTSRPECPKERAACEDIWRARGETIGIFEKFQQRTACGIWCYSCKRFAPGFRSFPIPRSIAPSSPCWLASAAPIAILDSRFAIEFDRHPRYSGRRAVTVAVVGTR